MRTIGPFVLRKPASIHWAHGIKCFTHNETDNNVFDVLSTGLLKA